MTEILNNPLCWLMFLVAICSYYFSFIALFSDAKCAKVLLGLDTAQVLTASLPLLGLLGTIVGLLQSFDALSLGLAADSTMLTSGIADALYTTELGLLLAIPGWLLATQPGSATGATN
jgi:biopolymer transport protein ExbB